MTEKKQEEEVKAPALPPGFLNFNEAEYVRKVHRASIPPGVPVSRLVESDYWGHNAGKVKAGDLIECIAQDGSFFVELMARKVDRLNVHVWLLRAVDLDAQTAPPKDGGAPAFRVEFGGKHKWRVVRSDGEVVHTGEPSKADAETWLAQNTTGKAAA
jgi:hypothetical protein